MDVTDLLTWLLPASGTLLGMLARRVQWWTLPQRFKR
jgi:hypothetical protein